MIKALLLIMCCAPIMAQTVIVPKPIASTPSESKQAKLIGDLRERYYRPRNLGLISFTCSVKFQFDTLPPALLLPAEIGGKVNLDATKLLLVYNARGTAPKLARTYPADTSVITKAVYDKLFDLLQQFILGFAQTWGAKAMDGPVPSDYTIFTVAETASGYRIQLPAPDINIEVSTNHDLLATEIVTVSHDGRIDEHPVFTASSQGLIFTGNDTDMLQGDAATHFHYDLDYQPVDTFLLPHKIHLAANDNIDVRFAFESCSVQKGVVIKVTPPPRP